MSAPQYLLDTDICIFIRRHRRPALTDRFRALLPGQAAISVVTYGELANGAERSDSPETARSALQALLQFLPVQPLPTNAGEAYGLIRAQLERQGKTIGGNDLWIAAHALAAGFILVTNNERAFRRVSDLTIENWAAR